MFETNVGTTDRIIRVVIGIILLAVGIFLISSGTATWGYILGIVGLIPLVTGLLSTCPIYSILGFSTCPMKTEA